MRVKKAAPPSTVDGLEGNKKEEGNEGAHQRINIRRSLWTKERGPFGKLWDGIPLLRSVSLPAVSQPNPSNWPLRPGAGVLLRYACICPEGAK